VLELRARGAVAQADEEINKRDAVAVAAASASLPASVLARPNAPPTRKSSVATSTWTFFVTMDFEWFSAIHINWDCQHVRPNFGVNGPASGVRMHQSGAAGAYLHYVQTSYRHASGSSGSTWHLLVAIVLFTHILQSI
jgi:hypothetical protein